MLTLDLVDGKFVETKTIKQWCVFFYKKTEDLNVIINKAPLFFDTIEGALALLAGYGDKEISDYNVVIRHIEYNQPS